MPKRQSKGDKSRKEVFPEIRNVKFLNVIQCNPLDMITDHVTSVARTVNQNIAQISPQIAPKCSKER
jgi:hypothetical protein